MKSALCIGLVVIAPLVFQSCDTPLNDYEPGNETEKSIKDFLSSYIEARNNGDIQRLASMFHDDAVVVAGSGGNFTKSRIADSDPDYWVEWGKIQLLNSQFKIEGDIATVSSTGKWGVHFKTPHVCTLIKEDGRWRFMKIKTGN